VLIWEILLGAAAYIGAICFVCLFFKAGEGVKSDQENNGM
jgi:hypothetical protein